MAITALKDFKIKQGYTKLIETALVDYFWDLIYKPMFKLTNIKKPKAQNSLTPYDAIISALQKGEIYYVDDGFKAKTKFNNKLSLALEKLGAKWNSSTKSYKIQKNILPPSILFEISNKTIETREQLEHLKGFITYVEDNIDSIVDTMVFDNEVVTILDDAGKEIQKNVKKINTIAPELSPKQKDQIAQTYTENMQLYVKDWTKERIVEMRKKVEQMVLDGIRPDAIQTMLEKEYGIMSRKAKFLSQNETTIMLAAYKKAKYQEMGFNKFIWRTITDGKERTLHKDLNGTIWSYDNPPIIDERTGQRGLPGETYNCRCEQIPFRDDSAFTPSNINTKDAYYNLIAKNTTDDDIEWITVKGNHIPIEKGQTKEEAIKKFLENKEKEKEKEKPTSPKIAGVTKGKPMTFKQANEGKVNPNYKKSEGYNTNCQSCVAVFEARKRGYNIETLPFDADNKTMYSLGMEPNLAYTDKKTGKPPEFIDSKTINPKECEKWLKKEIKLGQRYAFGFKTHYNTRHIVTVSKKLNGQLQFYDPQSGESLGKEYLNRSRYCSQYKGIRFGYSPHIFRIDNAELNTDIISKISKKAD